MESKNNNPSKIASACLVNTYVESEKSKQLEEDTKELYKVFGAYNKKYNKILAGFNIMCIDGSWMLSVCTNGAIE